MKDHDKKHADRLGIRVTPTMRQQRLNTRQRRGISTLAQYVRGLVAADVRRKP